MCNKKIGFEYYSNDLTPVPSPKQEKGDSAAVFTSLIKDILMEIYYKIEISITAIF